MSYVISPDCEFAGGRRIRGYDPNFLRRRIWGHDPNFLEAPNLGTRRIWGHDPNSPEFGIVSPNLLTGMLVDKKDEINYKYSRAGVAELADALDSKSEIDD